MLDFEKSSRTSVASYLVVVLGGTVFVLSAITTPLSFIIRGETVCFAFSHLCCLSFTRKILGKDDLPNVRSHIGSKLSSMKMTVINHIKDLSGPITSERPKRSIRDAFLSHQIPHASIISLASRVATTS